MKIRSLASISPQGISHTKKERDAIWSDGEVYTSSEGDFVVGRLSGFVEDMLVNRDGKRWEKGADRVTKMARLLGEMIPEDQIQSNTRAGLVMASSRGAAESLENAIVHHQIGGRVHPLTSPWTTLGSTASWLARDLGIEGMAVDTSMTCSSGFHALYQAAALLKSGMQSSMWVGAVEAPITAFGIAQFKSLGVLSRREKVPHCMPFHKASGNTMVMSEGGVLLHLDMKAGGEAIAEIAAIGIGREDFDHPASISDQGIALENAMKDALGQVNTIPDVIIPHAPGTLQGDAAEGNAISAVFGESIPAVASPKWRMGHTFGASGLFGLELAIHLLDGGEYPLPYSPDLVFESNKPPKTILVNATGFGGNAISIVVRK